MTTARCVAVLLVLVARAVCAADFSAAEKLYSQGDYEGAFVQWQALAEQGDSRAQFRLAQMFSDGVGVRKDDRAALHWYGQAAEQGLAVARFELALMYSLGRGVRQDFPRAAYWYRLLAEDGHVAAQYLLAEMYRQGNGVAQDLARAARWYRHAAEAGHVDAQVKLAGMYSQGHGVNEDLVQAWRWFALAAAEGHDVAAVELTGLRRRLSEEELAEATRLTRDRRPPPADPPSENDPEPARVPAAARPVLLAQRPDPIGNDPESARAPEMVRIESGCFAMGSAPSEAGRDDNEPRHPVCVEAFSISRYEVTRGQYAVFVSESGRETPDHCQTYSDGGWRSLAGRSWRDPGYAQSDEHPVACVSRDDALAYAEWLSEREGRRYRLPTESEWEYAARAGSTTARPWGNDAGRACVWGNVGDRALRRHYRNWSWTTHPCDDGHAHTAPVGSYRVSLYGVHDMAGNVWEWTCSSYAPAYRGAQSHCTARDRNGVVRGGSWSNSPRWVRSAARFENRADARFDLVGFRLAHD